VINVTGIASDEAPRSFDAYPVTSPGPEQAFTSVKPFFENIQWRASRSLADPGPMAPFRPGLFALLPAEYVTKPST
jgi:hypothetical protein